MSDNIVSLERRQWSEDEIAFLVEHGPQAAAERTGRSWHSCRSKYNKLGLYLSERVDEEDELTAPIELPAGKITKAKPDPSEKELESLFEYLEKAEAARDGLSPTQQTITVTAPDNMPTAVAWMSDIHAGASGVDYARFRKDIDVIAKTEGLYTIVNGDLLENAKVMSKAGNALYHAAFANPREQYLYVLTRMRKMKHKILAILSGNHDSRDAAYAGIDRLPQLCRELDVPYGTEAGMTTYLEVGSQKYTLVTKHDYQGKSNITKTNSARRLWTEWPHSWEAADVISLAHLHEPNIAVQQQRGRDVVWMRSGAYKVVDEYALSKGYKSVYGVPLVVFFPDTRKMVPFIDFDEGVRYLNTVRAQWREDLVS